MSLLLQSFAVFGLLVFYWMAILLIHYLRFTKVLRPINPDWPVWVYTLRPRVHRWHQERATDLGGYLIIVIVLVMLWLGFVTL